MLNLLPPPSPIFLAVPATLLPIFRPLTPPSKTTLPSSAPGATKSAANNIFFAPTPVKLESTKAESGTLKLIS